MAAPLALFLDELETPVGTMLLIVDEAGALRVADFHDYDERMRKLLARHYGAEGQGYTITRAPLPVTIRDAFSAYFAGDLAAIDAIPVATGGTDFQRQIWAAPVATGGTDFQRQIWAALRTIPAGTTISYGELARRIGNPSAVRAVGLANGANPIAIVVPCHRVIGANNSLTGYGGGLHRKQWLLEHESQIQRLL